MEARSAVPLMCTDQMSRHASKVNHRFLSKGVTPLKQGFGSLAWRK
jgi:6-phosphogluconate dehydrogenase (decarboxylating)